MHDAERLGGPVAAAQKCASGDASISLSSMDASFLRWLITPSPWHIAMPSGGGVHSINIARRLTRRGLYRPYLACLHSNFSTSCPIRSCARY